MTPEDKAEIRRLWETTPMYGAQIAQRYGVSKNAIIGLATRGGWVKFLSGRGRNQFCEYLKKTLPYQRTTMDRLDALHKRMDQVLEECRDDPRHHC